MRGFVEREALEIAEHHGRAEGARQAVDLAMQRFGLFTIEQRLRGRYGGTCRGMPGGPILLGLAPPRQPATSLSGRANRHAVEPVAQQLRLAERPGLAGQNEEDSLEGVLGVMAVAEELPADVHHQRPVAGHQGGERGLTGGVAPMDEPLEQLTVGKSGCRTALEEHADLSDQRWRCHVCHAERLPGTRVESMQGLNGRPMRPAGSHPPTLFCLAGHHVIPACP